jgi:plasmid rolling circle replication initiator protein Rep|tara:strand:+ start:132 stop:311 length:180 start_codon:yes stop_codon:yes gene_type:complete
MSRDRKINPFEAKRIARQKYAERQIDKFVKWSWEIKGKVRYKDIVKLQDKYEMKFYGRE